MTINILNADDYVVVISSIIIIMADECHRKLQNEYQNKVVIT